jgi:adenylate cyclase
MLAPLALRMSIFARLFLLIGLVSGVSLATVAVVLWRNAIGLEQQLRAENIKVGNRVLEEGTRRLQEDLQRTHLIIVREKASTVESYFSNIAQSVQLQSALASQFLSDAGSTSSAPPLIPGNTLTGRARQNPALRKTLVGVRPYAIYHVSPAASRGAAREAAYKSMERLRRLGGFFARTQNSLPGSDSVYFGSSQGFILGYPGGLTYFKNAYDPRARPWYVQATEPKYRGGALSWIVSVDRDGKTLLLTCAKAVSQPGNPAPIGVAAIDVRLPNYTEELKEVGGLEVSEAILVDEAGQIRVSSLDNTKRARLDRRGLPVTTPIQSRPAFAPVWAHLHARKKQDSGLYWDGQERERAMAKAQHVFIYARVAFATGERSASQNRGDWYYIVQLPMKPLLEPIEAVTGEVDSATNDISNAIEARTRQSVATVRALVAATLLAALCVAYFAARAASRPLVQMASVARNVGQGKLEQQAVESGGGEIGELGRAINAMIAGLRQRDLLADTMGRYVAPHVVKEVLRRGDVQLGGSRKVVTVFFSDLAGFTTLAEKTPPEVLIPLLNEYFEAMTSVILETEGTLDKYIGDAILAFWGDPLPQHDDAARACRAALQQRRALQVLGARWEAEGRPRLDMRIGIETGEVTVGDIGSTLKVQYTVLGDTVNFASRLEAVNKVFGTSILIGEQTRAGAGDAIEVREIDFLAVAGKSRPVRVFELLGMAGDVAPARLEGCAEFERGLFAFRERRWDEAEAHLQRALQVLESDKPSQNLLARVRKYRTEEPPADWDGSLILVHK